jgi:hypothetical protein
MVSHGSLFCSNITIFDVNLSQLRHLRHLRHLCHLQHLRLGLFILQALCEVVGQPTVFCFSEKMTSLELSDIKFVILDIFDHHLVKIGRKFT